MPGAQGREMSVREANSVLHTLLLWLVWLTNGRDKVVPLRTVATIRGPTLMTIVQVRELAKPESGQRG